jgi:pimeloyl-ACP methyl ester carboxylesterase
MYMAPIGLLIGFIINLISLALVGFGLYFVIGYLVGIAAITAALFYSGIAMLVFSLLGRYIILALIGGRSGEDEPKFERSTETQRIKRPDGTELHVEFYGPADAQPIVFTHGIATNSTDWYYAKQHLADRYRLILWDVTGLGKSGKSPNNDYSTEKMAADLEAVINLAGRPCLIAGHSMGGMITLTFCKLFPQYLGSKVAGVILVNTTYTDPVKTTTARGFLTAIETPILKPLMYLIAWLHPLFWLQSWLSYFNGTAHIPSRLFSFAGTQTRGQLDFMTVCQPMCNQGVLARQMLGMMKYDATETLPRINVPTLIVTSDTDRGCIPEASHYMHEQIPGSELVEFPKCGHVSIFERNLDFTQAVDNFARRVATPRRSGAA